MPYREFDVVSDFRALPTPIEVPLLPASTPQILLPPKESFVQRIGLKRLLRFLQKVIDPEGTPEPLCLRMERTVLSDSFCYTGEVELPTILPKAPRFFRFPLTEGPKIFQQDLRLSGARLRKAWKGYFRSLERKRIHTRTHQIRTKSLAFLASGQFVHCPRCNRLSYARKKETFQAVPGTSILLRRFEEVCESCALHQWEEEPVCPLCQQPVVALDRSQRAIEQTPFLPVEHFCEVYRWRCTSCAFSTSATRLLPAFTDE